MMQKRTLIKPGFAVALILAMVPACSGDETSGDADSSTAASSDHSEPAATGAGGDNATDGSSGVAPEDDVDQRSNGSDSDDTGDSADGGGDPKNDEGSEADDGSTGAEQAPVLNRIPGDKSASCVDTTGMRNARSGGIAAGPFDELDSSYGKKLPGKPRDSIRLYWIPMHGDAADLTVRVTKAGGGTRTTVTEGQLSEAEQWKFFDTFIPIEEPGTWELHATAGPDQGCFTVTVG